MASSTGLADRRKNRGARAASGSIQPYAGVARSEFPPPAYPREITSVYTLYNLFARHFTARIQSNTGISMAGWCIVDSVANAPGVIASQLGNYWSIDKTLLSRTLFELENAGILERRAVSKDRRVNSLHLTPHGQELHRALKVRKEEVLAGIDDVLTPKELASFYGTSTKLIAYLRTLLDRADVAEAARTDD